MTGPAPFPKQAETLKLRSKTRPVVRLNRKVLLAGCALGVLALFAVASIALDPPKAMDEASARELYNVTTKRAPEGLSDLPSSYEAWTPPPGVPQLGAPQSGDLGGTIVAEEDRWGIERDWNVPAEDDFRPSQEDEALRAKRLSDAKLADQAERAGVFFELSGSSASPAVSAGSKVEGLPSEILALASGGRQAGGLFEATADPNLQDSKAAFAQGRPDTAIYNANALEVPVSPFQVMAGTLIPASLVTAINSDLPGTVIAQVTQPVYDTVSGTHVLIPQGTRLMGRYQSQVSTGQSRALVIWDRIIFPDGTSLLISDPATDATGAAGLSDRTDNHWNKVLAAAGLATLLGVGAELGADGDDEIARAIRRGTTDTVSQAGQRIVDRKLAIQPTLRIRPGWPVRVLVTRDLVLRPYQEPSQ